MSADTTLEAASEHPLRSSKESHGRLRHPYSEATGMKNLKTVTAMTPLDAL